MKYDTQKFLSSLISAACMTGTLFFASTYVMAAAEGNVTPYDDRIDIGQAEQPYYEDLEPPEDEEYLREDGSEWVDHPGKGKGRGKEQQGKGQQGKGKGHEMGKGHQKE